MGLRGLSVALVVAIAGVIAGSLVIAGILSFGKTSDAGSGSSTADASRMPLDVAEVFTSRERSGDAIGGSSYLKIDEGFVDDTNHCEFCIALEYKPGPQGKALVAFSNIKPVDLGAAKKLTFAARGDEGGEILNIYAAGKKTNDLSGPSNAEAANGANRGIKRVTFAISEKITLNKSWNVYEIRFENADLSEVTHGFAFELLKGKGNERQVVYLDSIIYSNDS